MTQMLQASQISEGRQGPATRTVIRPAFVDVHMHYHVFGNFHIAPCDVDDEEEKKNFLYFRVDDEVEYIPFADDFGPMNLGSVYAFCNMLSANIQTYPTERLALQCGSEPRCVTNTAFLTGCFMIMRLNNDIHEVTAALHPILQISVPYRDVSPGAQNFNLYVEDCWKGLYRAKQLSWVDLSPGSFDHEEYTGLDSPLNADLHEIVPGKFVAMRGPKDMEAGEMWRDVYKDGRFLRRDFSPKHYADILLNFGVQVVVRLNEPHYAQSSFTMDGIAVADLSFEDCTSPPVDIVAKFLAIAEATPGALAVHCKAGLGRTGTLIALYMMKNYGFTAREAMGWLRIVRPGSVIGEQQTFLCDREATMRRSSAPLRPSGVAEVAGDSVEEVQRLIDETVEAYDARYARAIASQAGRTTLHRLHRAGSVGSSLADHVSEAADRRAAAHRDSFSRQRSSLI
jgi:cell division cycle 14